MVHTISPPFEGEVDSLQVLFRILWMLWKTFLEENFLLGLLTSVITALCLDTDIERRDGQIVPRLESCACSYLFTVASINRMCQLRTVIARRWRSCVILKVTWPSYAVFYLQLSLYFVCVLKWVKSMNLKRRVIFMLHLVAKTRGFCNITAQ